jgi:hypothetical protein
MMSSSSSSLGGARLYIDLKDTESGGYHVAGKRITGSVYVEILTKLPEESTVVAYFTGEEHTKVRCIEVISNYYTYNKREKNS